MYCKNIACNISLCNIIARAVLLKSPPSFRFIYKNLGTFLLIILDSVTTSTRC